MSRIFKSYSFGALILAFGFLAIFRLTHVTQKELSWDILGYYLYLPSTFIYDEPLLDNYDWLKKINEEKDLTGTYYMVSTTPDGKPMYFFLMGMSYFYLPSFLAGHAIAGMTAHPQDGFSPPYYYSLIIGALIITLAGLIYLRKILLHFFPERIAAIIILLLVFGTNYVHHMTVDSLATVNVLFMLMTVLIYNTILWHRDHRNVNLVAAGVSIILMGLVKPSEVIAVLIFLLWDITSWEDVKLKWQQLWDQKFTVLLTILLCLLIALPQILYWYVKTGYLIYDSYKNPGVGLDLLSPHIIKALVGYRKGWFLYTPLMIFAVAGFYFLFKNNRKVFVALAGYWLLSFYIITSWTEYWYGASFSNRALITTYPVLAITFGYFLLFIFQRKTMIKIAFTVIVLLMVFLNQFQWWQLRNYILDPYRTTKAYYWAIFLKTRVTDEVKSLKLVERSFSGAMNFHDQERYRLKFFNELSFDDSSSGQSMADSTRSGFFRFHPEQEYSPGFQYRFDELTLQDHAWVKAIIDVRFPENFEGEWPCLVMSMEYKGRVYGYHAPPIRVEAPGDRWQRFEFVYLTPEIRRKKDVFKCYVWKRSETPFDIDNFRLEVYDRK